MRGPHRFETGARRPPEPEAAPGPSVEPPVEEVSGLEKIKVRLAIKNRHIQELYEELAGARLSADEVRAVREVGRRSNAALEKERDELKHRLGELEEQLRRERNRRPDLERALGEREAEVEELRAKLEEEYGLRRRMAGPQNRLRAGIELFNESEHRNSVTTLSRSMGQPEVRATLEEGEEPAAILGFTWQGITWQTYASNPGLAIKEPRVYLQSSGEDLSGVHRESPNAHVGAGGRVFLGV